jgi:hypothetical protein
MRDAIDLRALFRHPFSSEKRMVFRRNAKGLPPRGKESRERDATFLDTLQGRYGDKFAGELVELIERFAPTASRFLEWGSGESTRALCAIASTRPDPMVLSIDSEDAYQRSVAASLPLYNFLHFRCLDLQGPSESQDDQGASYSSYPYLIGLEFDVALIDGRRRSECALTAAQVVAEGGVILVHDWRRARYRNIRALFDTLLEGEQFLVLRPRAASFQRRPRSGAAGRRVVIVPARGARAKSELKITLPFTEAYARQIGADCVVVGENSALPVQRLKSAALDVARSYDRALVIDADVLIRPGSPDVFAIVPEDAFGAFPEGRFFPREDECAQLNELYDCGTRVQPQAYFNSGVMVFSSRNIRLLEALRDEAVWGHPQFEQGFLNAKRIALGVPLFPLTSDFNFMPDGNVFPRDWRYSFFLHHAGSGKRDHPYRELWQDVSGDRRTFAQRKFSSADVRAGLIQQAAEQVMGRLVRILDATDFCYEAALAKPIYDRAESIVAYFPSRQTVANNLPAVWGPDVTLEAGLWRGNFLRQDGDSFVYRGAMMEVVKNIGKEVISPRSHWPANGVFEFRLTETTENVDIRIYRPMAGAEFACLRLERISG